MGQSEAVQQAATRLDAAVDKLSKSLGEFINDIQAVAALREQIRSLTDERDRLRNELEIERDRARRLEAANDEVSHRLQALSGTLKTVWSERSGGAGLEI
jgi:chromosome segregation ATPase